MFGMMVSVDPEIVYLDPPFEMKSMATFFTRNNDRHDNALVMFIGPEKFYERPVKFDKDCSILGPRRKEAFQICMEGGLARIPSETVFKVEVVYYICDFSISTEEWCCKGKDEMMEVCKDLQRTTFDVKVMQPGKKDWTLAPPKEPLSSKRRFDLLQKMAEKLFNKKPFLEAKIEQSDGKDTERVPFGTELLHFVENSAREERTLNYIQPSLSCNVHTGQERKSKGCLPVNVCQALLKVNERETQTFKKCDSNLTTSSDSCHILTGDKFGDISPVDNFCKPPSVRDLTAQGNVFSVPQTLARETTTSDSTEAKGMHGWESTSHSGNFLTGDRFSYISPVRRCGGLSPKDTQVSPSLSIRRVAKGRGRPTQAPTSICSKAEVDRQCDSWESASNSLEDKRRSSSCIVTEFVPAAAAAVGDTQGDCSSDDSSPAPSTPVETDGSRQSNTRCVKGGDYFGAISPIERTPMHSIDWGHVLPRATDEHGACFENSCKVKIEDE